jgi:hypothetical protein
MNDLSSYERSVTGLISTANFEMAELSFIHDDRTGGGVCPKVALRRSDVLTQPVDGYCGTCELDKTQDKIAQRGPFSEHAKCCIYLANYFSTDGIGNLTFHQIT